MGPETELRVAEPLGILILLEGLVRWLEASRDDRRELLRGDCSKSVGIFGLEVRGDGGS
jgi:hypothetical protein